MEALVKDMGELPDYWRAILRDYPQHPVLSVDPGLTKSLGCTFYSRSAVHYVIMPLRKSRLKFTQVWARACVLPSEATRLKSTEPVGSFFYGALTCHHG